MGRKPASGSGIRDEQPGSYFLELRPIFLVFSELKYLFFDADPGWRQFGFEIRDGSRIRDKYPGSATLKYRYIISPIVIGLSN
jgi:hypothetical protein